MAEGERYPLTVQSERRSLLFQEDLPLHVIPPAHSHSFSFLFSHSRLGYRQQLRRPHVQSPSQFNRCAAHIEPHFSYRLS